MISVKKAAGFFQEGGLYALLLMLPFSKAVCEISFFFLLTGWLIDRIHPATRAQTVWVTPQLRQIKILVVVFLAICALSITGSQHLGLSIRALFSKWLEYLLFFVIVVDVVNRPLFLRRALITITISSFAVAVEAVTQEIFGAGAFRGRLWLFFERMTGPFGNPNDLAIYLTIVIPIVMMFGLSLKRVARWIILFLVFLLVLCLAKTEAVMAWAGLFAGLIVLMSLDRSFRFIAAGILVVIFVGGALFMSFDSRLDAALSLTESSKLERFAWMRSSVAMIMDRPLLGHGINTFMANYLDYRVGGSMTPVYAHNCYLQMAAETGFLGLTAFLGLLGSICIILIKKTRKNVLENRKILLGMIVSIFAFLVHAAFDTHFYSLQQAVLFWVIAGMALGISTNLPNKSL